jgi:hypothetical protein
MTDPERIALLRRSLESLLTVVDEDYTKESQADEPRIVKARHAMAVTAPTPVAENVASQPPPDYPDMRNDFVVALKHISNLVEIIDRIDGTYSTGVITESEADELAAVAEFLGDRAADVPVLTLYEVQVTDEGGDYSTRHFGWTRAEALSAAAQRAEALISQFHRHPTNVHTSEVNEYALALTQAGVLKFLDKQFGYLD